jgi:polyisoprenoid-binding protein YceI
MFMKNVFFALFTVISLSAFAQAPAKDYSHSYVCKNGKVHFFSSTPLEDIEATQTSAICVFNTQTKMISATIPIKKFDFKQDLMEEHFNENYLESDKYPTATLKGTILENLDFTKDGTYDVTIKGTLEIHGVVQEREIKGKITIKNGAPVNGTAVFDVKLVDHKIKVPQAVFANIAEVIKIDVSFDFVKYQQ